MDPYYYLDLTKKAGHSSLISNAARSINESMPSFSAEEVLHLLDRFQIDSPNVLVLGYSYKPETGDIRDTPVREFSRAIASSEATVFVWDPFVEVGHFPEWVERLDDPIDGPEMDIVVLATAHSQFIEIDWEGLKNRCKNPLVYDGRRALSSSKMKNLGWEYYGIGYPVPDSRI